MLRETETEVLKYDEFLVTIKEVVKDMVNPEFCVEINHVIKNNSVELDGLAILGEENIITPNIYLNPYYQRYMNGEDLVDLAVEIVELYQESMEEGEREKLCINYELDEMKPYIIFRLINRKKNNKLLQETPHLSFLDLAITFHCLVKDSKEGIGTIRITNDHLERWSTDINELKRLAIDNTPRLFPFQFRSMNEVIKDIFTKEMNGMFYNSKEPNLMDGENHMEPEADPMMHMLLDQMEQRKSEEMFVLTNSRGINGASCLLYPNVLEQIAGELNSDFYILPSSIHEVILVINQGGIDKFTLKEMVCDVNKTQVAVDEVLSDQVYYYSRDKQQIMM
jgi:hypothetical protein